MMVGISRRPRWGRVTLVASIVLGASAVSVSSHADPPSDNSDQNQARDTEQVEGESIQARARVQKVDPKSHMVTLTDASGKTFSVHAGPGVDLRGLRVGDTVLANYFESVAVDFQRPNEPRSGATERMTESPDETVVQTTVDARVASVDMKNDKVTIDLPSGGSKTVRVKDPELKNRLGELKPGNTIRVTYTQASAISIEPSR
jgi:Cu/Ag efflux protein CusF